MRVGFRKQFSLCDSFRGGGCGVSCWSSGPFCFTLPRLGSLGLGFQTCYQDL